MKAAVLLLLIAQATSDRRKVADEPNTRPAWAAAVARFTWTTKRGATGAGTAVLVAPDLAMTAHHCIKDFKDWRGRGAMRFGFCGAKAAGVLRMAVGVVASSASGDWAILRLNKPIETIRPLVMATGKMSDYDTGRMRLAGYSCDPGRGKGGMVLTYDDGCRSRKIRTNAGRILTDAICYYGASGGPAFVKGKGADQYHWIGLVQGNINSKDKKSMVTYVVYQNLYQAALRRASKAGTR